jgi:hypothetical protein
VSHDPTRHPIACQIDGKTRKGIYWVAGKILVVSTAMGGKSTQLGAMSPEAIAGQLLRNLVKEGKAYNTRLLLSLLFRFQDIP